MNKNLNLQDVILNQIRKDKIASTFILMNGSVKIYQRS